MVFCAVTRLLCAAGSPPPSPSVTPPPLGKANLSVTFVYNPRARLRELGAKYKIPLSKQRIKCFEGEFEGGFFRGSPPHLLLYSTF